MHYRSLIALSTVVVAILFASNAHADGYAVVVSKKTLADAEWSKVVKTLQKRHQGQVVVYDSVGDSLPSLQKQFPRHTCFVATREEATRQFVADVHRLTRKYDSDPYTDTLWGILTGYDAANALEIAETEDPLVVKRVASGNV